MTTLTSTRRVRRIAKPIAMASLLALGGFIYHKRYKLAQALALGTLVSTSAHAQMSEQLVRSYAQTMQNAANSQNIGQIARLLADDVVISLTRPGKGSATLDKSSYLDLLQKNWSESRNYRYNARINDIVVTGDTARAQMVTTESFVRDGQNVTMTTTSRATFGVGNGNAVLLRSVSQVTVD